MQPDSQVNDDILTGSRAAVAVVDDVVAHVPSNYRPRGKSRFQELWLMMMFVAAMRLHQYHATRYRGYAPRLQSTRELARSRGYRNAAHMQRVLHEKAQLAAAAEAA